MLASGLRIRSTVSANLSIRMARNMTALGGEMPSKATALIRTRTATSTRASGWTIVAMVTASTLTAALALNTVANGRLEKWPAEVNI